MPANRHSREITEQQLQQKASARAVASFVLGILSVVLCGIPIMLVAAVVGMAGRRAAAGSRRVVDGTLV